MTDDFIEAIDNYSKHPSEPYFEKVFCRYHDMNDTDQEKLQKEYAYCLLHWSITLYKLVILNTKKRLSKINNQNIIEIIQQVIYQEKQILLAKIDIWIKICDPQQEDQLKSFFCETNLI
jgi:hypothetical protein